MIKFEHDGLYVSYQRTCKKYDGVNTPRWNLEFEPFVGQWVIQREENTLVLAVIENHMSPWNVVGKGKYCYQLVLKFQAWKDIDQP